MAEVAELLYLFGFFQCFSDFNTVAVRSAMTKVVGPNEVGRIFACVGISGAVVQLIKPMYEKIYSATLDWYFGFVYCISDMITLTLMAMAVYIYFFMRHVGKKKKKEEGPTAQKETQELGQNYKRIDFELSNSVMAAAYDKVDAKADSNQGSTHSISTISAIIENS